MPIQPGAPRPRSGQTRFLRSSAAALAAMLAAGVAAAADRGPSIDQVNRRWDGALCRTRIPLELKKRRGRDGWTKGPWVWIEQAKTKFRIFVRERSAIEDLLMAGEIPPGTDLVAEGWRSENPDGKRGLVLELRFADAPAELRFEFYGAWTRLLPVKRLGEMERLMRLEILEILTSPDEQLIEVDPTPGGAGTRDPHAATAGRHGPAGAVAPAPLELRMIAVAVQPVRAAPGDEVSLVLTFAVTGGPEHASAEILERRAILSGDTPLTVLEERLRRGTGTFTSSQPVRLPADLSPGVYTLRGTVSAGDQEASGTALFEVAAD